MKSPTILPKYLWVSGLLLTAVPPAFAEFLTSWEMTGQTGFGTENLPPTFANPSLVVSGLTRGPGVVVAPPGDAAGNAWGGTGWDGATDAVTAVTNGDFITFTVDPNPGVQFTSQSIDLHYRRSGTGPSLGSLQYQIGSGEFVEAAALDFSSASSAGATLGIDLLPFAADLQGTTETVTFRIVPHTATGEGGTFYIFGGLGGPDLVLNGSLGNGGPDITAPLLAGRTPLDDATGVSVDSASTLTLIFNEDITTTSGNILVKKVSDNSVVNTIDVSDFDVISLNGNTLGLPLANQLQPNTAYYVEIPAGAITDTASSPNAFGGFTGNSAWNFTTSAAAASPRVVINKYLNATPDRVELLVIGTGAPNSTVNLQGMILKDFSTNMTGDGGGNYTFSTTQPLWEAVRAGTLITLSKTAVNPDLVASDFTLSVGLSDTTYFSPASGGSFDISTTEMVMIKEPGSAVAGTAGAIHTLAAGSPGTLFTPITSAKVIASATTGTNLGVKVNNTNGTIADFISGTDATGALGLTEADFGASNSPGNAAYITALRGLLPGDGDATITLANATSGSALLNRPLFDPGTGQSLKLSIVPKASNGTTGSVTITIPASLGTPTTASLSGPGSSGASVVVNSQTITITGASATPSSALEVTINGLNIPTPTTPDLSVHQLSVSTAAVGGTLTPVGGILSLRTIIPIELIRGINATGVALNLGATVAVSGVVTEADFGGGTSAFSGFLQDATGGVNIFSSNLNLGLVYNHRFVVVGAVAQFNGLTEVIPASLGNIFDLGVVTPPVPQLVTLTTLLANPEAYEGELITVANLSFVSGAAPDVILQNGGTQVALRFQAGSEATAPAAYPVDVTGIWGQFDSSSPFNGGYQLMPRFAGDIVPATSTGNYSTWATAKGISGVASSVDSDKDGLINLLEYALGFNPTVSSGPAGTYNPTTRVITFPKGPEAFANGDVDWQIETSPDLNVWSQTTETETDTSISFTLPAGAGKIFARLVVE